MSSSNCSLIMLCTYDDLKSSSFKVCCFLNYENNINYGGILSTHCVYHTCV